MSMTQFEDLDVCAGFVNEEAPVLAEALRTLTVGSRTATTVCAAFLGLCPYPDVLPIPVTIPARETQTKKKVQKQKSAAPLRIVHLSDLHIDRAYISGSNWNCTKPICCRSYTPADAPGVTDYAAGPFGSAKCDTPVTLEESLYAAVKQFAPGADFMFFTGDVIEAAVWQVDKLEAEGDLNDMYKRLKNNGFEKVYAVVGNHDVAPVNLHDLPVDGVSTTQWVFDTLAENWQDWIGEEAVRLEVVFVT